MFPSRRPASLHVFSNTQLHGPWLLDSTLDAVNRGSNAVDVFPSVHVAASLYLLLFDWRHWRAPVLVGFDALRGTVRWSTMYLQLPLLC